MSKPRGIAISIFDERKGTLSRIYEDLPDFDTADLLAQLAMRNKKDTEIVCIMPGWYRNDVDFEKAKSIEEQYRVDRESR